MILSSPLPAEYGLFEILIWFVVILIISLILERLVYSGDPGPFKKFIHWCSFIGIAIHELCHAIMCVIVRVPIDSVRIKYRLKGRIMPHGEVELKRPERINFGQAFMIALAPLFINTYLFFWSLSIAATPNIEWIINIIAGFFCISLLLGSAPSMADLGIIGKGFRRDSNYALYQIFLVIFSGIIIWSIIYVYNISLTSEIWFYVFIGFGYVAFKYLFKGLNVGIQSQLSKRDKRKKKYGQFTKRHILPKKNFKWDLDEAQW